MSKQYISNVVKTPLYLRQFLDGVFASMSKRRYAERQETDLFSMSSALTTLSFLVDTFAEENGLVRKFHVNVDPVKQYSRSLAKTLHTMKKEGYINWPMQSGYIQSAVAPDFADIILKSCPGSQDMYGFFAEQLITWRDNALQEPSRLQTALEDT